MIRVAPDVRRWAEFYRSRGYNPLPSDPARKRPMTRYARWWDEPAPADLFDLFETTNVQVMTGRRWRLLVIDLDGPEAGDRFAAMGASPITWATHSGGGGVHLWFSLPAGHPEPLPKAVLWRGVGEHAAIERLCDRSLIVAPPSVHPRTGRRYRFLDRRHSPAGLPLPAPCPAWILELRPVDPPRPAATPVPSAPRRSVDRALVGRHRPREVAGRIADKAALARSWGLRLAGHHPNAAGWVPCHAIGREDRTPSASFSPTTGNYWEPGRPVVGLFDLAAELGVYRDWREAVADLGEKFR